MCGRFSLIAGADQLALRFGFEGGGLGLSPNYNVAPTQSVLTVRRRSDGDADAGGDSQEAALMRWGLVPSWARDLSGGARMINARAETVAERPAFRAALQRRRCLVVADGFYEWRRHGGVRTPMRITLATGEPFAFAGLWEAWRGPDGALLRSCTIITTTPNELVRDIHDRMPVILPPDAESLWLDPASADTRALTSLLTPYPAESMYAYAISTLVNSPANNTVAVIAPAP